jgi:hypothetical protein
MRINSETSDKGVVKITVEWHPWAEHTALGGDGTTGSLLLDAALLLEIGQAMGDHPDKSERECKPLPRITPEMQALWDEYAAAVKQEGGAFYYPSEVDRFKGRLWQMFEKKMGGG